MADDDARCNPTAMDLSGSLLAPNLDFFEITGPRPSHDRHQTEYHKRFEERSFSLKQHLLQNGIDFTGRNAFHFCQSSSEIFGGNAVCAWPPIIV
jgi:hypothetical protein